MTWHDHWLGASLLVLLVLPIDLSAQDPALVGCYDVELGAWTPELDNGEDSLFLAPPPRIRLAADSSKDRRARGFVLEAAPGALPSIHRFSWWKEAGPDSVSFSWTNGFSGIRMQLGVSGRTLRGYARTFWDFSHPIQTADAVGERVSCDAPLRKENRFAYRFPRGVLIEGADSVRIGEALPRRGVQFTQEREHVYRLQGSLAAPFAGAKEVRAIVDTAGVVGRIVVYFKSDVSHQEVLEGMIPLNGEPTSLSVRERADGTVTRHAIWYGRVMEIWLVSTGRESEPLQLQILDRRAQWMR